MTLVARLVVSDIHLSVVIHPQSTHYDIVNGGCDLAPGVVIAGPGEQEMSYACI